MILLNDILNKYTLEQRYIFLKKIIKYNKNNNIILNNDNIYIDEKKIFLFKTMKYYFNKIDLNILKKYDIKNIDTNINANLIRKKIEKLKKEIKTIKITNKYIKNRLILNEAYKIYKNDKICSIDCEYFKDPKTNLFKITEIGYTIKNFKNKTLKSKHYIINENIRKNYRPFLFGFSEYIDLKDALNNIEKELKNVKLIVGNSINIDINLFKINGLDLNNKILDLSLFTNYFIKSPKNHNIKYTLKKIIEKLNLNPIRLHNAGNDSYYSIKTFCKLINLYNNNTYENFINNNLKNKNKNKNIELKIGKNRKSILLNNEYKSFDSNNFENEYSLNSELYYLNNIVNFSKKINLKDSINLLKEYVNNTNLNIFIKNNTFMLDKKTMFFLLKNIDNKYKMNYDFSDFPINGICTTLNKNKKRIDNLKDLNI